MQNINIKSFLYNIIYPYRFWYLLMLQAPILVSFFIPLNNYALKLLIDNIGNLATFDFFVVLYPFAIFCFACLANQICWRISNFAYYHSQPKIEAKILENAFKIIINRQFLYFQNNLSGKIASKIVGIQTNFVQIQDLFHFEIIRVVLQIIISLIMLFFVHIKLAILVMLWLVVLLPVCFVSKKKLANLSAFATNKRQEITGIINDAIANIATIFAFASKNKEQNLLSKHNNEFIFAERKRLKFLFINHIFIGFAYCLMSISILYLLIKLRQQQIISNGELAMVFSLIYFTIDATWQLLGAFDNLLIAVGNFKESFLALQNHETNLDKTSAIQLLL